jgi:putative sterol carrier protein
LILDGIFWQMPQHLDRQRAAGMDAAVEWRITGHADGGADVYRLTIVGGRARARRGSTPEGARVTITLPGTEFLRLVTGLTDPMQAYFGGKIKLAGDIMFAASLQSLFRIPVASRRPLT